MNNRAIRTWITELQPNEIFVFGSNLAGIHGAGAAKKALIWGAKWGAGEGLQGQTYAIPTKNEKIQSLKLPEIKRHVEKFIEFAKSRQDLTFLVTEVGCGLAGYTREQIAPFFSDAKSLENVHFTEEFWQVLNRTTFLF